MPLSDYKGTAYPTSPIPFPHHTSSTIWRPRYFPTYVDLTSRHFPLPETGAPLPSEDTISLATREQATPVGTDPPIQEQMAPTAACNPQRLIARTSCVLR